MDERLTELSLNSLKAILEPLRFSYECEVLPYEDNSVTLMIASPDARFLIGDEGDRLEDLQYLVNRMIQAKWEDAPRVRVDCDHYRERAEARLLRSARSRAERVLKTGKPLRMEALNAYQRRLVHNELAKIPGIRTASEESESRFKRITISRIGSDVQA